jgi:hypothetical protein
MKKIILISLVILFAICSKSWAEGENIDGINLHCKSYEEDIRYYSSDDYYIFTKAEMNYKYKAIKKSVYTYYPFNLTENTVLYSMNNFWIFLDELTASNKSINRKTLEYSIRHHGETIIFGLCKIVDKEFIIKSLEKNRRELIKKYEEKNKKEREGNKI